MKFFLDDVPLLDADKRWDVLETTTVGAPLSARASSVVIPGMHGAADTGPDPIEAPQITLAMRFYGSDQAEMMRNYNAITMLMRGARVLRRDTDDLSLDTPVKFVSVSAPTYLRVANRVHATYVLQLSKVFWRGPQITWNSPVEAFPLNIMQFANMTADVLDAKVMLQGSDPAAKPMVACGDSWFKLNVDLDNTQYAMIDTATFKAYVAAVPNWDGSGTDESTSLETSGDPYCLILSPAVVLGDPRRTATHITVTGASNVWVQGKAAYII